MEVRREALRHREPAETLPRAERHGRGGRTRVHADRAAEGARGPHRQEHQQRHGQHHRLEGRHSGRHGQHRHRLRGQVLRRGPEGSGRESREPGRMVVRGPDGERVPLRAGGGSDAGLRQGADRPGVRHGRQRQVLHPAVPDRQQQEHRPGEIRAQPPAASRRREARGRERGEVRRMAPLRSGCLLRHLPQAHRHGQLGAQRGGEGRGRQPVQDILLQGQQPGLRPEQLRDRRQGEASVLPGGLGTGRLGRRGGRHLLFRGQL